MKDIPGYEGMYAITKNGQVFCYPKKWDTGYGIRYLERKAIAPWKNERGYWYISLRKDGLRKTIGIHRLVAKTYLPNPLNLPQVNHKNGIKTDNSVSNLEWATAFENTCHAWKTGLNGINHGEKHYKARLTIENVSLIRTSREPTRKLAERFGVSYSAIRAIRVGKSWKRS